MPTIFNGGYVTIVLEKHMDIINTFMEINGFQLKVNLFGQKPFCHECKIARGNES